MIGHPRRSPRQHGVNDSGFRSSSTARTTCAKNRTTLHLLSTVRGRNNKIRKKFFSRVLNSYPEACLVKDAAGCMPLHCAWTIQRMSLIRKSLRCSVVHSQKQLKAEVVQTSITFALGFRPQRKGHRHASFIRPLVDAYPKDVLKWMRTAGALP